MNNSKSHCLPAIAFFPYTPPPTAPSNKQRAEKIKKQPLLAKKKRTESKLPHWLSPGFPSVQGRACPGADIPPPVVSTDLTGTTEQIRWHLVSTNEEWHVNKSFMLWRAEGGCAGLTRSRGWSSGAAIHWWRFPIRKNKERFFFSHNSKAASSFYIYISIPRWGCHSPNRLVIFRHASTLFDNVFLCVVAMPMTSLIKMTPGWMYCSLCY